MIFMFLLLPKDNAVIYGYALTVVRVDNSGETTISATGGNMKLAASVQVI